MSLLTCKAQIFVKMEFKLLLSKTASPIHLKRVGELKLVNNQNSVVETYQIQGVRNARAANNSIASAPFGLTSPRTARLGAKK
jgi:hypothetical protein